MTLIIRPLEASDIPALYQLYIDLRSAHLPIELTVSLEQFTNDLTTPRLYKPAAWYDADATIQLVATSDAGIIAYAGGRLLRQGDFLIPNNTGLIQLVMAKPKHIVPARQVINGVLEHLESFNPVQIQAFNSMTTPIFFGQLSGGMSSQWAWIAQILIEAGFEVDGIGYYLYRDMMDATITPTALPDDISVHQAKTYINDYCAGLDTKFNSGIHLVRDDDFVGWCGGFYSGAFVDGSGHDYFYIHWFTIAQAFRRQGYGRMLLRHVLEQAQHNGAKGSMLLTDAQNFVAQNLYFSEGYHLIDTVVAFKTNENNVQTETTEFTRVQDANKDSVD